MSAVERNPGRIALIILAVLAVIAALKAAGDILLPVMVAGLLAIIVQPVVRGLLKIGFPKAIAIILTMLLLAGVTGGLGAYLADSIGRFADKVPTYQVPLNTKMANLEAWALGLGVPPETFEFAGSSELDPGNLLDSVGNVLGALVGVVSNLFVVLLTTAFALLESTALRDKVRAAFGAQVAQNIGDASLNVQRYIGLKTVMSAATGILAGLLCWSVGVDFPVVWGFVAFLLNFIPSIGSFIAAIPPALLTLVGGSWAELGILVGGYVAINVGVGSVVEPRIMGRRLGLSPLVVFLSLIFWGWIWGPVGMLISVPLTVVVKLFMEQDERTRWVAVLLGPASETEEILAGGGGPPEEPGGVEAQPG